MLNKFTFQEILEQAKRIQIPLDKKRAILREYLQCRFLANFYDLKGSHQLAFIGGTSLRLLHHLDRFSEDLDFDNRGLTQIQIKKLVGKTIHQLGKEGLTIELSAKPSTAAGSFKIKFLRLLSALEISSNPREKLMIKFDYTNPKKIPPTQVFLLSRFGVVQRVSSYPLSTQLAYKFKAIKTRKRLMARDFYDVAWLLSRNVRPNLEVLEIKTEKKFYQELKEAFERLKPQLATHKKILLPFLIGEEKVRFLDLFEDLIESKLARVN